MCKLWGPTESKSLEKRRRGFKSQKTIKGSNAPQCQTTGPRTTGWGFPCAQPRGPLHPFLAGDPRPVPAPGGVSQPPGPPLRAPSRRARVNSPRPSTDTPGRAGIQKRSLNSPPGNEAHKLSESAAGPEDFSLPTSSEDCGLRVWGELPGHPGKARLLRGPGTPRRAPPLPPGGWRLRRTRADPPAARRPGSAAPALTGLRGAASRRGGRGAVRTRASSFPAGPPGAAFPP